MESVNCELCGRSNSSVIINTIDRNWRLPGEFSIVKCQSCGFKYLNPRPTQEEISAYYPETFSARLRQFKSDEYSKERKIAEHVLDIKLRPLFKIKSKGKILDVGCADGFLLNFMRQKGWEVYGVEPHEPSVKLAKANFGLDIFNGYIQDADFPDNFFDAVTMSHVLEHVHNTKSLLEVIHRILKPDGIAMFEVPNIESLESKIFKERWVAVDAPRHLYHFSPSTLKGLLKKNNFKVIKIIHGSDLGKNKLGYSESIRFILMDAGIKKAYQKPLTLNEWSKVEKNDSKKSMVDYIHGVENFTYSTFGFISNIICMGSRIVALAQKTDM